MNKFKYYFILLLAGISLVSCNKSDDDDAVTVPLRDYAVQYKADNDSIIKYLKTNYITVTNSPGTPQDQDVVIKKIVAGDGNVSIWDQKTYPLESRDVYSNDVTYKVYYLTLRKGSGESPTNTDKIVTSYTGTLLDNTVFDSSYGYPRSFNLFPYANESAVFVEGWSEIFPKFKTGTSSTNASSGVVTYTDFGAGVMFLPSGLAYYGQSQGTIPIYAPLVFSFKLFDLQRMDNEFTKTSTGLVFLGDGVPDYLEDINGDGYLYDFKLNPDKYPNPPAGLVDDTDGDGVSDFLDFDDDGDGFTTRFEVTKPTGQVGIVNGVDYGVRFYYPWDPILVDNPLTPNIDEREPRGIPRRPTGALADPGKPESSTNVKAYLPEDYTANPRLRIHLDKTYPIKQN